MAKKLSIQELFMLHAERCAQLPNMAGKQINGTTKREYQGMNKISLYLTMKEKGFKSNEWLTHDQAKAEGLVIVQGEHGTPIFNFKLVDTEAGKEKQLRYYLVFNRSQLVSAEEAQIQQEAEEAF